MGLKETLAKHPEYRYEKVYSPDDGGWYVQDWGHDKVSTVYTDEGYADKALAEPELIDWQD